MAEVCEIDGCGKAVVHRQWCAAHYQRWRKHGDPNKGKPKTPDGVPLQFLNETVLRFKEDCCLKWPFGRAGGKYAAIYLDGKKYLTHRVVCEMVHGPAPSRRHQAAHSCGKGHEACVNPLHLSWKLPTENAQDKVIHGTIVRGERHPQAKLTEEDVRAIRSLIGTDTQKKIAKKLGVSYRQVAHVATGYCWSWLE